MPLSSEGIVWDEPAESLSPDGIVWDEPAAERAPAPEGIYDASTFGTAAVNTLGAATEPLGVLASGAVATPVAGIAGLVTLLGNKLGITEKDATDVINEWQQLLTYDPVTESGRVATEAVTTPFRLLAEGGDYVGGKIAEGGAALGIPKIGAYSGALTNATLQTGAGFLAGAAGQKYLAPSAHPVVNAGAKGAALAGRTVAKVVDPFLPGGTNRAAGRILNEAAGDRAPAVIAELEKPAGPIPQTAGEKAAAAGSTELAGVQDIVTGRQPSAYADLQAKAEAARRGEIQKIGKTEAELKAAEAARTANANKNYKIANEQVVTVDSGLETLLSRPSMDKALARAEQIAKERGEAFGQKATVEEFTGEPIERTGYGAGDQFTVGNLHSVKMALDDLLARPEEFGIARSELAAIGATRKAFLGWLENKAPAYKTAREQFAAESKPINQMQVGQALEEKLVAPVETAAQRPTLFAGAVRNSPTVIKNALGHPRYTELSQVLNPEQLKAVDVVMENLQNKALYERQVKQGREQAGHVLGVATPRIPSPGYFDPHLTFFRAAINRLSGKASNAIIESLSEIMRDPARTAEVMKKLEPPERAVVQRIMSLRGVSVGGAVAGAEQQEAQQ